MKLTPEEHKWINEIEITPEDLLRYVNNLIEHEEIYNAGLKSTTFYKKIVCARELKRLVLIKSNDVTFHCDHCKQEFIPKSSKSRFCSSRCRVASFRKSKSNE